LTHVGSIPTSGTLPLDSDRGVNGRPCAHKRRVF
jgi:hypothetical protein